MVAIVLCQRFGFLSSRALLLIVVPCRCRCCSLQWTLSFIVVDVVLHGLLFVRPVSSFPLSTLLRVLSFHVKDVASRRCCSLFVWADVLVRRDQVV